MAELKQTNNAHAEEKKITFQNRPQIPAIPSVFKKTFQSSN